MTERRQDFMSWWHAVDVDLHARGIWSDTMFGETRPLYDAFRHMTPTEAADRILADRAKGILP